MFDFKLFVKPMMHQIEAVKFISSRYASLISFKTGTGKSIIMILSSFKLLVDGSVGKVVIIGTMSALIEVKNDFSTKSNYVPVELKSTEDYVDFMNNPDHLIGLLQYERVGKMNLPKIAQSMFGKKILCMFDEVHKIKTPTAQLTKNFTAIRNLFTYCVGLTATPLTTKLYDLFFVIQFLDSKVFGSKAKFTYNFVNIRMKELANGRKYPEIQSYKNLPLLNKFLEPIMLTYYPPQDTTYYQVFTDLEDMDGYNHAASGLLENGDVKMHATRMIDLQKIVNRSKEKKDIFVKTVKELINDGIVVYCHFHESIDTLSELLSGMGIEYEHISGEVNAKQRKRVKDWFNVNPSGKVLLITSAGSQSLNLQSTNKLIFYDIPFGFGAFSQTKGRVERIFSEHTDFHIYFIMVRDTIDEYKYILVSSYKSLTQSIFDSDMIPKSDLETYNAKLLKMQRNSKLWKEKKEFDKFKF